MLILLRIIFTSAFVYCFVQARASARLDAPVDDMTGAYWLARAVLLGIACAAVWAPFIGEKVADPLTGGMVNSPMDEPKNRLMRLIRWCEGRGYRTAARWLCFAAGVRAPWLPSAFIAGLNNATPGSWLEKVFAREVFRFNHAGSCIAAFHALQRHGIDPRPHPSPDVNMVLLSVNRGAAPTPPALSVPKAAPAPKPQRDSRIRIGVE